ncbi:hypothetical protein Q7P37_011228 [Cladosporium fusiforme]
MKISFGLSSIVTALLVSPTTALPSRSGQKPVYLVLAGDSTTAVDGGWGDGFLDTTLREPAGGKNLGHSGATTVSFRAGGDWAAVIDDVRSHLDSHKVFVTIQFGHNDQKPDKNISLADYADNLGKFVEEVRSAEATPILLTPLTRRQFSGTPPRIVENLSNEREATISVAQSLDSLWVDLNEASKRYCNAIGPEASWEYNYAEGDKTHLNDWGSVVFGRLVSDLLVQVDQDIAKWTRPNATLSEELKEGTPA